MSRYWKEYYRRHLEKVGNDPFRQVARTQNGEPMSEAMFRRLSAYVVDQLELDESDHVVLDLCCGNGLLSAELAPRCGRLLGVDFSEKLVAALEHRMLENVTGVVADALEVEFRPASFHRILFAAGLQHFSQAQTIAIFRKMTRWLTPGGLLLVTDVLDAQRMWSFYDTRDRENVYFERVMQEQPLLGTWFERAWLEKLARYTGFQEAAALDQPAGFWYSHYRFDLRCRR